MSRGSPRAPLLSTVFSSCVVWALNLIRMPEAYNPCLEKVVSQEQKFQTRIRTHMISCSAQASLPSDYIRRTFFTDLEKKNCLLSTLLCDRGGHSTRLKCLGSAFHGLKTGFKQVCQSGDHGLRHIPNSKDCTVDSAFPFHQEVGTGGHLPKGHFLS